MKDEVAIKVVNGGPQKKEEIHRVLRNRIFSGYYWPRERLIEKDLCQELDVQRSIIREVLKRLAAEKLVVSEHYKGCFVAEVSVEEAFQTYQVQAFLEGAAGFLATERITEEELDELDSVIERSRKIDAGDWENWFAHNKEFHSVVNKACGNGKLIELIKHNFKYMKYWFLVVSMYPDFKKRTEEHRQIFGALKEKNALRVREMIEKHIMQAGKDMRRRLERSFPTSNL